MQVECPNCEAPLDVETKAQFLKCNECSNEFRVLTEQGVVCPGCGSVLTAPEGASAVLCGHCRQRVSLAPEPPSQPATTPSISLAADEPEEEAEAHEETSVIESPRDYEEDRLQSMRVEFADRYEILEPLGHGGMGAIYKARQKQPQRVVVLKVMLHGRFASPRYRVRFEREAQAVARLKHPGIVSVYEYGEVNGQPYFTMEYVEGCDVKQYVLRHKLDKRRTCELVVKIARAVAYAHQRGVIHRDLKPNNILVDGEGNPRLLDFGLARLAGDYTEEQPHMTEAGEVMGTPSYMSPEQTLGRPEEMDIRADVYSIGVLFYELVTHKLPYRIDRSRPLESLRIVREYVPKRPSAVNSKIDGDLDSIIMKCLEKERDLRYQSAVELSEDIGRYLRGQPVEARPSTTFYHFRKLLWRHRGFMVPVLGLILTVTALTAIFIWRLAAAERQARHSALQARVATQGAGHAREQLLGFIMDLQSVRAKVDGLLDEGDWEEAHRIASFAEQQLPAEAGLAGLTAEVQAIISTHAADEARKVNELVRQMHFRDARALMRRLTEMATRLDLPALGHRMERAAATFDEACWQSLFSYIQQNNRSARALETFLVECPGNAHAREARGLYEKLIGSIRFTTWPFDAAEAQRNQRLTAQVLELDVRYELELRGGATLDMVLVPAGEFLMGSSGEGEGFNADQEPQHAVRVRNPLYMSRTEVTRGQFEAVMGTVSSDEGSGGPPGQSLKMPVAVSWEEARLFCDRLSQRNKDGLAVRLPTEAEWEHACRAGADALYSFGSDGGTERLTDHAWYGANSQGAPQPVGLKGPNPWGLYDMHGNMLEWCRDWYEARYYLTSLVQDPGGPETGTYRALRGGCWSDGPDELHSAYRKAARPESIRPTYGFRVCLEVIADYAERPTPGAALRVSGP